MGKILIISPGIRRIPHGEQFTTEFDHWEFNRRARYEAVAGWGHKTTAERARQFALKKGIPYVALEDGFLRSVRLGRDGEPPLSLVVDPVGIYYDARQPSQLEQWLEQGRWSDPHLLERARSVRTQIRTERLSKYNNAPDKQLWPTADVKRVLVIDQTYGDMSVTGAMADATSFRKMLEAALDENPQAEIVVKTHPDVLAGHREGYLGEIPEFARIQLLTAQVNPWSVLDGVSKVYTVSSLLGFEALLAGKKVRCFGMPFYAGWGLTADEQICSRRSRSCSIDELFAAAYLKYARYVDPITEQRCEIEDIIPLLSDRRRHWLLTRGKTVCSGVAPWKRKFLPAFLSQEKKAVSFAKNADTALEQAQKRHERWALWSSKETAPLRLKAESKQVQILRVEDAFLRSVGLGSDLVRPGSLALDDEGIYYDGFRPSRLETLLRETIFNEPLLKRAELLHKHILANGLTKYNIGNQGEIAFLNSGKPLILIPGQVEDDASVLRSSPEIKTNLELLRTVRKARPDGYIAYKPHPDVFAGNRTGMIDSAEALLYADEIVTDLSMDSLLSVVDEVHTMTSLSGFEALLRGCKVSTYGLPFYAGWGLTEDRLTCSRRGRQLNLAELIAGTLILYPTYVHPGNGQVCAVEHLLDWLAANKHAPQTASLKTRAIRFYQRIERHLLAVLKKNEERSSLR
ncbi:capsular polysaccharide biosynthesis protein [Desulfobulbus rhabdoformis]|uniref:capsular polysaccharide biosynthesis protein n=1 Tax=Desulfobulbus rhabdoformis TaxID=34032 RepID=UPI0019623612|nr:capsular polysaccharide biosynthesis protein [Desulfobulbus rhabdoformis]MBM9613214.1 capsular polysaccharide biosynthesis protein [Desulfobulbus rhabdoformis]